MSHVTGGNFLYKIKPRQLNKKEYLINDTTVLKQKKMLTSVKVNFYIKLFFPILNSNNANEEFN